MFIFSNGVETVKNDSLTLDSEVTARLRAHGSLRIVERDALGAERVIYDASTPATPQASAPVNADSVTAPIASTPVKSFSDFGDGAQVHDATASARIHAQHAALVASGVALDTSEQLFATGTRMAREGYRAQALRKAEHDRGMFLLDAAGKLRTAVTEEQREDRVISSGDFARALHVNGSVTCHGFKLTEQSIRGLLARIDSPALSYVLGLRNRIAEAYAAETRDQTGIQSDRDKIGEILAHECKRNPDVKLKLRTRRGIGDIFAIVSPSYVPADAPAVLDDIVTSMPRDARGSYAYDPTSTTWELRAEVWTPTPVDEQAVGEPFRGYISFQSRDNGTARFRGGGGIELIRCLNASTYTADGASVARRHMGDIMRDIQAMTRDASKAVHALCKAWGVAREAEIETPASVPLSVAIPGFWRYLLKSDRDLALVLPGRKETHVKGLTRAFEQERRDSTKLVRADLAQGWTRYIQNQPGDVRREAEAAIGSWIVGERPVRYEAAE